MQLIKKLIRSATFTLIALAVLTPQRASCQFSDSTIREINERLIELYECRKKQSLYEELALNDGKTIHRQDSIIQELIIATNNEKAAKYRYQKISAFSSLILLLALIL
jgi:hypothetical protein